MSKERARRREEREREAAIQAAARAAEAERTERRAARKRALTRWLPKGRTGPSGVIAERHRTQTRLLVVAALILNAVVWLASDDWAVRVFALLVTALVLPVAQILMTKN
ncbi:hypothetical protein [Nocardioides sp. SR21]|uniref:hypothetical protein n=1 Tax=Nocardioides sp. SR21 TaxID=2919501 RepID=UPI001FAA5E37|nr:hypothetical protein [Nocardioides sp. SR21]